LQAVLPRLRIYAAKARLRELKAELLEARLAAQEEKLDVAAAMGWYDEAEQEADEHARCVRARVCVGGVVVEGVQEADEYARCVRALVWVRWGCVQPS
jgi:hypothetical protein